MQGKSAVEIADVQSRKRAIIVAVAAIIFFIAQLIVRPFEDGWPGSGMSTAKSGIWAINAILLLVLLATGGGLFNKREISILVNDEVSRENYRTSVVAGFWTAMTTAMGLYFYPRFESFPAAGAIYVIVTVSIVVALLVFSYLELRAHRDA
jgi:hypothetical protein